MVTQLAEYEHNYQGGQYRITESAKDILGEYGLKIDPETAQWHLPAVDTVPELDDLGYPYPPEPLESWGIPGELVGRQKGKPDAVV